MSEQNRCGWIASLVQTFGVLVAIAYGLLAMVLLVATGSFSASSMSVMLVAGMTALSGFREFCRDHYDIIEHEKHKPLSEPVYWGSLIGLALLALVLVLPLALRGYLMPVIVRIA